MSNRINDIEFRSESVKDIINNVPSWPIRWGSLLFLVLFLAILFLSWIVKYPEIIEAEAILTTKTPPQKEYAKVSGIFDTILVSDSQQIKQDDVLAIIENTADFNDVYFLKSILDTLKFDKSSISFPFDNIPILFLGEIEPDFTRFENSYFQYQINKEFKPFENEALANKVSINELKSRLRNITDQQKLKQRELDFKKSELKRTQELFEKGVLSKQEMENKQTEYLIALRSFENMGVSQSQLRESINNAEKTSKGTQFNKSREEIRLLKEVLQSYKSLQKAIKEWELKYVFKSKIKGQVSFLEYWNENQNVNIGDLVFTVLPEQNSEYLVRLNVQAQNTGKIKLSQKVNVSLWDYPDYEFGVIQGEVSHVSKTSTDDGTYKVDVALNDKLITSYGKEIDFKQEMKGSADIITEDLRLVERLLYQLRHIFKR